MFGFCVLKHVFLKQFMNTKTLQQLITTDPDRVLVIDVRERDEIAEVPLFPAGTAYYAEFPLSVLRMLPRTELVSRLHEKVLEKGRDRETVILVLSCRSGGRSCQAQTLLADAGIVTESLDGGVLGWQEEKENETAH